MAHFPVFLSLVLVVRNEAANIRRLVTEVQAPLAALASDYEVVVVDNASDDQSVAILKELTEPDGLPNLQVFALTKEVDSDTAYSVGMENALGDFVAVMDPLADDIAFLPTMLDHAVAGADIVFALNEQATRQSLPYRVCSRGFNSLYERLNGIDLSREAPQYRVLSKRVINFILQHPQPSITYRHLPATRGFTKANLTYSAKPSAVRVKRLSESIDRGMRLLVTTTRTPMRLVTSLSLLGAMANVVYSLYVIAVWIFKSDVAPGWVTLSLQQSGMFFLLSLVLLVLGEYILQMSSLTNEGPRYHVGQEFTSTVITRRQKLNIEEHHRTVESVAAAPPTRAPAE
jgi:polyisoprenyl-phosphate glycosyltransferase